MPNIHYRDWESGDWVEVLLDGEVYHSGHEVPDFIWLELLQKCGATVTEEAVSDDGECGPDCPCRG